ncbi:MAG TPA: DUF4276 family protein [Thermoanaerobaculia bacterium]|nr:DUF4276 family protein [Thermoanaerobaculia bacterium]
MKVGVVVEGQSEFTALPELHPQLCSVTNAASLRTLHACYDPYSSPGRIVRSCRSAVRQLAGRKFDLAIVLIDREEQTKSSPRLAAEIEGAFEVANLGIPIQVVIKDRSFENWLIADLAALRQMRKRFHVTAGMTRSVEPDRADRADAFSLLKRAAKGDAYGKVDDAKRILEKAQVTRMAAHSRSFRCFLARLGYPGLQAGSCTPVFN